MDTINLLAGLGNTLLHYLVPFLFVLTVVVFIHELGHFLVARWCGVAVKVFSIGFGPEIFGFYDSKGTRWRVSWIPLGGYVKFIDDENVASASGRKVFEALPEAERKRSFQGKSLGQRAAIVAAGPIANFILAIVIFTAIFSAFGERITAAKVDAVSANSAAERAGFQPGPLGGAIGRNGVDLGRGDPLAEGAEDGGKDENRQDEIGDRPRRHDGRALAERLALEAPLALRLRERLEDLAAGRARDVLVVDEFHVAAEGNPRHPPAGALAVVEAEDLGTK